MVGSKSVGEGSAYARQKREIIRILTASEKRVSGNKLLKEIGGRRETLFKILHQLRNEGWVIQIGKAGWRWVGGRK